LNKETDRICLKLFHRDSQDLTEIVLFVGHKFPVLQMLSKLLVKTVNKHVCQVMNSIKQTCVSSHEKYKTNICVKS